jgi:rod shape-determining protein MreD
VRLVAALIAAPVLQLTVVPAVAVRGLAPDLFLVAAILLAFRQAPERAALQGLALGLLQDALAGTPLGLRAFVLSLVGFASAVAGQELLSASRMVRGLLLLGMAALSGVLTALTLEFFRGLGPWAPRVAILVGGEAAYSALVGIPCLLLSRAAPAPGPGASPA